MTHTERTCATCAAPITVTTRNPNRRYCSARCRVADWHRRNDRPGQHSDDVRTGSDDLPDTGTVFGPSLPAFSPARTPRTAPSAARTADSPCRPTTHARAALARPRLLA
jgi:hypothetical protein